MAGLSCVDEDCLRAMFVLRSLGTCVTDGGDFLGDLVEVSLGGVSVRASNRFPVDTAYVGVDSIPVPERGVVDETEKRLGEGLGVVSGEEL